VCALKEFRLPARARASAALIDYLIEANAIAHRTVVVRGQQVMFYSERRFRVNLRSSTRRPFLTADPIAGPDTTSGPFLSTSGETLTIEESMTLRARTENAGHAGDEHERSWSWSSG
jgi:hypothetical protein